MTTRFCNHFQLFKLIILEKCVLTILGLNWNQRLGHKKTKLNICHHLLTSSTQLQNRSFHVVERTKTSSKYQKMKSARAKRAKILFFIVKYANLSSFCCRRRLLCLEGGESIPSSKLLGSAPTDLTPAGFYLCKLQNLDEFVTCFFMGPSSKNQQNP